MLATLIGLDHVVIAVRDLDAAARAWAGAGFTVAPRGLHSAPMGTANHTIMLGEDYLELMGVAAPTPLNAALRDFLRQREGLERLAFTTTDAAAGHAALAATGVAPPAVLQFGRAVTLPDATETEARFSVLPWPADAIAAGLGLFACQHHTRDAVWLPSLTAHANGATRIAAVLVASDTPAAAAAAMAGLIAARATARDGLHHIATGPGRAALVFGTRSALAARYGLDAGRLPAEGGAGLAIAAHAGPPAYLTGCTVVFGAG